MNLKRTESIDFLRGVAVLSMFITHSVLFTAPKTDHPLAWLLTVNLSGDWGAGLFAFLLGMSLAISIDHHRNEGMPEAQLAARTLKRAVALFGFGFVFPIVIWGLYDGLYWDALTMLAGSIAILWFLRKARPSHLFAIAAFMVLISPFMFKWLHGPEHWARGNYKAPATLLNLFEGFTGAGYFPIFPWAAFALIGFGVGRGIPSPRKLLLAAVAAAMGCAILWRLRLSVAESSIWSTYATGLNFYPLSVPFFLLVLSIGLTLFATAHAFLDGKDPPRPWMNIFRTFSRYSFTLYVLHYAVLIFPQRLYGWWVTGYSEAFVRNTLTVPQGLIIGPSLAILFYALCRSWDKVGGRFSMEWWLKKIVNLRIPFLESRQEPSAN